MTKPANTYTLSIFNRAEAARIKAQAKFPQPNFVALKVAEEAGEVVRAAVHYAENRLSWDELEGEVIQTIAMCLRLLVEGDQVNGIIPPAKFDADLAESELVEAIDALGPVDDIGGGGK